MFSNYVRDSTVFQFAQKEMLKVQDYLSTFSQDQIVVAISVAIVIVLITRAYWMWDKRAKARLTVLQYKRHFPMESDDSMGRRLFALLEQIDSAQQCYKNNSRQLPQYFTKLLELARNEDYIAILKDYSNKDMTYENQHEVKSQLASELDSVSPDIVDEGDYPLITLGRGARETLDQIRYIHPITAMQTFAQFYHLDQRWPGCLATFYPDKAQLDDIMKCSQLCHHFFGGYAAKPIPASVTNRKLISTAKSVHSAMTNALKQGLHAVGSPGSGKTALLSAPILLAALCGFPVTIVLGEDAQFGVLSIDPAKASATMTIKGSPKYTTDTEEYTKELLATLCSSVSPSQPHLIIIDPLEQATSSDVLYAFNRMYQKLSFFSSKLLVLSAHSTPRLKPSNQSKSSEKGQAVSDHCFLQFTNMELSHLSLQALFTLVLQHILPQQDQNIEKVLQFIRFFAVPTIRSYQMLLEASRNSFSEVLKATFPTMPPGQLPNFSRYLTLNKETLGELATIKWLVCSAYVTLDTDTDGQPQVTSQFLLSAIPAYYQITRRGGIDEENALCTVASLLGARWQPIRDGESTQITKVIENSASFVLGLKHGHSNNITVRAADGSSKQVLAKYLNELHHIGKKLATVRGLLVRLSTSFPLFDFLVIISPTNIEFISIKTGFSDNTSVALYDAGARCFAEAYERALKESPAFAQADVTFEWYVATPEEYLARQCANKGVYYQRPENLFGISDLNDQLLKMLENCPLIGSIYD